MYFKVKGLGGLIQTIALHFKASEAYSEYFTQGDE